MTAAIYLQLAEMCERTAGTADLPEAKAGMLTSAAVWRRLAMAADHKNEGGRLGIGSRGFCAGLGMGREH
jgi:hypothetical protein